MRRLLALALVAALFGGACGSGKKAPSAAVPQHGGTLRLGVATPTSLDPMLAHTIEETLIADQLFDGLTAYDPKKHQVVPALAATWTSTPDLKQFDFNLRPDARFASGRPIVATDVKYSLERIAFKDSGSPAADLLELVSGYQDIAKGATHDLKGVSTPSPQVVRINLDQPLAVLPSLLASPLFGIVAPEAVEAPHPPAPWTQAPVSGSGPFEFKSKVGDVLHLVRRSSKSAYLAGIDVREYHDVASAYGAFRKGAVDWSRVPPDNVASAGARYGRGLFVPYVAELFYAFNVKSPKLTDVRFRQAIVQAVDSASIIRSVYQSTVLPSRGVVVAGVPGAVVNACGAQCALNRDSARDLIRQAFNGSPPPEIFLDFDEDVVQRAVANAISADLKTVGVTATLRPHAPAEYAQFANSGTQEMFRLGWIAPYVSPDAFLAPLFATGSRSNLTGFSDASIDGELAAARGQINEAARLQGYQKVEADILKQVPVLPIAQFQIQAVARPNVHGLIPTPLATFDASKVWVDPVKNEK